MGILITLRNNNTRSYFRELLLKLINLPDTNKLVLSSGYIQEICYRNSYSILDDDLLLNIQNGLVSNSNYRFVTIAGMFKNPRWQIQYNNFIHKLQINNINVTSINIRRKNWHAKIAVKLRNNIPVAAIIGSSNLTKNAYGINFPNFNYECDVTMWSRKRKYSKHFLKDINFNENPFAPIYNTLSNKCKMDREEERLDAIYKSLVDPQNYEKLNTT